MNDDQGAPVRLDLAYRSAALEAASSEGVDLLVIGGGVVGAGAALDAATRGLRVALVEAGDWGGGTSSRSSRLIHGGIRYLEQMDFALVREALVEQGLLLRRLAPHLVRPVRFLYPVQRGLPERLYVGTGMAMYDAFRFPRGRPLPLPPHKHLGRAEVLREMPGLDPGAVRGGLAYYDGQVDDARLVVTLARTAAALGARVISRARVVDLLRSGGWVAGARVRDELTGEEREIRARAVVNATGVWTAQMQALSPARPTLRVTMSKGVHLLVDRDRIDASMGLLLRTDRSVLFVIPWGRRWLIGTTDTPYTGDPAHPTVDSEDVSYLLDNVNRVLARPLRREDILGVYAGLRPLVAAGDGGPTTKLSREHVVETLEPGFTMIAGGKLTTYRVMARDVVDAALADASVAAPPSRTAEVPLVGARRWRAARELAYELCRPAGLADDATERLLWRYGDRLLDLLHLIDADAELGEPVADGHDALLAEARYAVEAEGALTLEDVLTRRLRLTGEVDDLSEEHLERVAAVVGEPLGWSEERRREEVSAYLAERAREREGAGLPPSAGEGAPDGRAVVGGRQA